MAKDGAENKRGQRLQLVTEPKEFFYELIRDALSAQRVSVQPETEFYLVHLMERFISTESLYPRSSDGSLQEEALALMVKDALEQVALEQQRSLFRHVGDFSLYVAGFFQDSLNRKIVDLDYYIGMGGAAYRAVAEREDSQQKQKIYGELAEKFPKFVDVLAEVSDKTTPRSEKDLLRMYDVWVRTRSERAARALQEAGIIPSQSARKTLQ
ncbi:hypothetical protein EBZ37_03390 [bacterium]|nr:hypothetical protein [bacterium]